MYRVVLLRRQIALELGIVVPPIRLRDNLSLPPNQYRILIRGSEVARGELQVEGLLALNPGELEATLPGIPTTEPAFGLPALWIGKEMADAAKAAGYTVVDPASVLLTHLTETIRRHAGELLSRQDTQALLDLVKRENPVVVEELVPSQLTMGEVHRVLQRLLEEGIPIRDLVTILEVLGDRSRLTRDVDLLAEYVRHALARTITQKYLAEDGTLQVITLDPSLERLMADSVQQVGGEMILALDPAVTERFVSRLANVVEEAARGGVQPVLLCSTSVRRFLRRMVSRIMPQLPVISYDEVAPGVEVRSLGMVDLGEQAPTAVPVGED
jgi:flagellar biosynthesis protein FlhA